MAIRVCKIEAADVKRRMVSCKIGPKIVVGVGSREKERSGSGGSNCRPPLRKFCCRGKQRSKEAAREEQGSRLIFFILFLFLFSFD